VIRLIILYLHLVPIGYGFQGMVMLLASALNGVRASSISFLFNGLRLFGFLLPGAWLGASGGENRGYIWGSCWPIWRRAPSHGGMPDTASKRCAIRANPERSLASSYSSRRLLFALKLAFDGGATLLRMIVEGLLKRRLSTLETTHLHPELVAADQLVGQFVAQPGLQQQDPEEVGDKTRMINSRPASASIMPPITSRPGISPCCIFCWALNRVLSPSLRTEKSPEWRSG